MRRLFLLAVLVPSLAGCGWSNFFQGFRTSARKGRIVVVRQPRVNPGSPMPSFPLGKKRLHQLAVFLEASKGIH
jgi:hypothetical protein